jgi:hypothetical protein
MKPWHAAALALVGWYLMTPLPGRPELSVEKWAHIDSFYTAAECREAGYQHQRERAASTDPVRRNLAGTWECIASDDPRLKEK